MGGGAFDGRHHRHRFFGPSFGYFGNPYGYPYGYGYIPSFSEYPLFGPTMPSEQGYDPSSSGPVAAQDEGDGDDSLADQVQALSDEVEQLRQERNGGVGSPSSSVLPTTRAERLPTLFAFRDGRKMEAVNFVVTGKTLWVIGDQSTRRSPLSDLDLAMTKKLNDQRGSEPLLPETN